MKLHLPLPLRASLLSALLALPALLPSPASAGNLNYYSNLTLDGNNGDSGKLTNPDGAVHVWGHLVVTNHGELSDVGGFVGVTELLEVSAGGVIENVTEDVSGGRITVTGEHSKISNVGGRVYTYNGIVVSAGGVIEHVTKDVHIEDGNLTVSGGGSRISNVGGYVYAVNTIEVSEGGVISDVGGDVSAGSIEVRGGGVIEQVTEDVSTGGGMITVSGTDSKISGVGGDVSARLDLTVSDGGEISDAGNLKSAGNMTVNGGTLEDVACGQDDQGQDIVGTVGGTLEISNGSSIINTRLQVAGAITVSDSTLASATLTSTGGDISLSAVSSSGSGSTIQTQGSHDVILTGDVKGEHTIISAADLQIQPEQGVCVSGSSIRVAGRVTGTDLQLVGGSLTTGGTELRSLALSDGASYTDTGTASITELTLTGQDTSVTVNRLEVSTLLSDDAASHLQATELEIAGSDSHMAGTVQADVLTLSSGTTRNTGSTIAHLSTGTLRYTFLQTGSAPLTLGSYSSSVGSTIIIDLTDRALASGEGTYTLLSLSGAGAESLDVSDFTLNNAKPAPLGESEEAKLEAELSVSADGQSLLVTLSEHETEDPDKPGTPEDPDKPGTPEQPVAGVYESSVGAAASTNGRAGLRLTDQATAAQAVQPGSDMDLLLTALDEAIGAGNTGAADGIAAQLSGASATTLGLAFAADAQRHMGSIRNRLTTMKVDAISAPAADPVTGPVPAKSKPVSAWVNAEGSYQTMEQSSSAPGYSMSSWGGTLGVELSPLKNLSCGLALTALYGDLDADARDAASGDLDTCYISAFGQYRHSAWTHTLVASLGMSDISLERTVSHSQGSYRTSGDTTGSSLGFLYELSCDIPLNGGATTIIQPLVNVSYLHTSVDGYTETGSDAALRYGKQSMDSVSLSLGGRVQSLAGESVFNRSALLEARALAKFNCGDRRSAASVGFANGIGLSGVESAEVGVFGVELGAGLTVPLGSEAGSVFVDASYELYSEYSNLNASIGYRLSF